MTCEFSIKTFDELTSVDLYHILKARSQVFVVEQNCAYQDIDDVDFDCLHLVAHNNETLIGYCRIIPPEFNQLRSNLSVADYANKSVANSPISPMPAIGRVLVLPEHRGHGLARQIMIQAIACCHKKFGKKRPIIISAQTYLIHFYESLGFVPEGEVYFEDGLEHVKMILSVVKKAKAKTETSYVTKTLSVLLLVLGILFIAGLVYLMT